MSCPLCGNTTCACQTTTRCRYKFAILKQVPEVLTTATCTKNSAHEGTHHAVEAENDTTGWWYRSKDLNDPTRWFSDGVQAIPKPPATWDELEQLLPWKGWSALFLGLVARWPMLQFCGIGFQRASQDGYAEVTQTGLRFWLTPPTLTTTPPNVIPAVAPDVLVKYLALHTNAPVKTQDEYRLPGFTRVAFASLFPKGQHHFKFSTAEDSWVPGGTVTHYSVGTPSGKILWHATLSNPTHVSAYTYDFILDIITPWTVAGNAT